MSMRPRCCSPALAIVLCGGLLAPVAASGAPGPAPANLVYVPLTPCRVIDTRIAGAGGPLAPGVPRSFFFRGPTRNYATTPNQGGSASGCGIPDLSAVPVLKENLVKAVAVNLFAVAPASDGDLRAWPANQGVPLAAVMTYAHVGTQSFASGVILTMCNQAAANPCSAGDITIRADFGATDLVVDVVGYFSSGGTVGTDANLALGRNALFSNTSGNLNTALGSRALVFNTTGTYNTAVGGNALAANTSGVNNTGVGNGALYTNSTGSANTAIGEYALFYNTTGIDDTATGFRALRSNTSGNYNTATGSYALTSNTTGVMNTATGMAAMRLNTTGIDNTASGAYALSLNVSTNESTATGFRALKNNISAYNTGIGSQALRDHSNGAWNTASGAHAMELSTAGSGNTANGFEALLSSTGAYNTGVGFHALQSSTSGSENTAIGKEALRSNTTGTFNTAVGTQALLNSTTTNNNVALGYQAGLAAKGNGNIFLGVGAGAFNGYGANDIEIGNTGGYADANTIRIGTPGTQTATFIAGISGVTSTGGVPVFVNGTGQLGTVTSSRRFKEDIRDLGEVSERLFDLRPVSFRYKRGVVEGDRPLEFGLIAEDVEQAFPELVVYGKDGLPETVKYHLLVPLLLNELQKERAARIEQQQTERGEIARLRADSRAEIAELRAETAAQRAALAELSRLVQAAGLARAAPTAADSRTRTPGAHRR